MLNLKVSCGERDHLTEYSSLFLLKLGGCLREAYHAPSVLYIRGRKAVRRRRGRAQPNRARVGAR